ncbi:MAG TPA: MoxR family ATPase [Thermoanaerobaculia bacterium]|nr:MoxR family ATPase [Thermoanaerobaculia bacterium]
MSEIENGGPEGREGGAGEARTPSADSAAVAETAERWGTLRSELDRVVIGQARVKEQLLACLLAGGHALLEGVPGTAKTLLALCLARLLGGRFRRVQFTPDLMPADLLGTNVFNQKNQEFEFRPGPIFCDLLLADEINRTPPRTQAALLEAMQERAATIDGRRYGISPVFSVLATQNPIEFEGTYPLPEAQRDRFLLKISIDVPSAAEETELLAAYSAGHRLHEEAAKTLQPVLTPEQVVASRRIVSERIRVEPALLAYIQRVVGKTREHESVQLGAGPRASLALLDVCRALALLRGRDFATPDDVKEMAGPVLEHRVILTPEAEMEGLRLSDLLRRIFEQVEVPR